MYFPLPLPSSYWPASLFPPQGLKRITFNHNLYLLASDSFLSLLWSGSESELITIASSQGSNGLVIATPDKWVPVLSLCDLSQALDTFILPLKHPLHPSFPPHLIPPRKLLNLGVYDSHLSWWHLEVHTPPSQHPCTLPYQSSL